MAYVLLKKYDDIVGGLLPLGMRTIEHVYA
jgi:hypothetical protein